MPTETAQTIELTNAQITRAFEDWEIDYRANPDSFLTAEETAAMQVAGLSEGRMIAFKAYARQNSGGHDVICSQPLQPLVVRLPGAIPGSGDATVVVQIYALGLGVTVVSEEGHLLGREGTFELETAGMRFVVDPLACKTTQGLVLPVQSDVGPVGQSLETVDQINATEFAFGDSWHGDVSSLKTTILALPQGMGKTSLAQPLANWLGCTGVVDEWAPGQPLMAGALHLTNSNPLVQGGAQ